MISNQHFLIITAISLFFEFLKLLTYLWNCGFFTVEKLKTSSHKTWSYDVKLEDLKSKIL